MVTNAGEGGDFGTLPVSVVFESRFQHTSGWRQLYINLYNSGTNEFLSSDAINLAGGGLLSGTGSFTLANGLNVDDSLGAYFDAFPYGYDNRATDSIAFDDNPSVAFNSLQVDFFPGSDAPEPGTIAIMGSGLVFFGLVSRRMRRDQ